MVTVTTSGGASNAVPSAANSFHVVNEALADYQPVITPALGVQVGDAGTQLLDLTGYTDTHNPANLPGLIIPGEYFIATLIQGI